MAEQSQTGSGLRVLHVVRPSAGGIRRHVALLCRGLVERGIRVEAAVPRGFDLDGVNSVPLHKVPIASKHHIVRDVRAAIAVAHLSHHCQLLHGHGVRGAWICYLASRRSHTPFVFTAHNLAPTLTGQLAPRLVRTAIRAAAARIAVSNAVVESYVGRGVDSDAWTVVSNGIDLAAFENPPDRASVMRSLGIPKDARLVIGVGRLAREKGFDRLIEAAASVLKKVPDSYFVLAGDGPEQKRLEAMAAALGSRFLLPGRFDAVYGLMSAADLVAVPSFEEGQGIVALEAMAAGKPVVAARVGGLVESIIDGETGILVTPDSADELAKALISLLKDTKLRTRMGNAGRERVKAQYTAERMVTGTLAVYTSVCPSPDPA